MLRMLNRLLSLGYSKESILEVLLPKAAAVSATLVFNALQILCSRVKEMDKLYFSQREQIICNYAYEEKCCSANDLKDRYHHDQEDCYASYRREVERYSQKAFDQHYEWQELALRGKYQWELQQNG